MQKYIFLTAYNSSELPFFLILGQIYLFYIWGKGCYGTQRLNLSEFV